MATRATSVEKTVREGVRLPPISGAKRSVAAAASFEALAHPFKGVSLGSLKRVRELGKGGFSTVSLHQEKKTGQHVVVKTSNTDEVALQMARAELRILIRLAEHENLVKYYGQLEDPTDESLHFAFEYIQGGDLLTAVVEESLSEDAIKAIFRGIMVGLDHIHSMNMIHRDLKLENILLTMARVPKIVDFGFATLVPYQGSPRETQLYSVEGDMGSPAYLPPEFIKTRKWSQVGDWWSLGVLLCTIYTKTLPFKGQSLEQTFENIQKRRFVDKTSVKGMNSQAREIVYALLELDPLKRVCSANDLLKYAYFLQQA